MELKLARIGFPALATEGLIYVNDAFECYSLEPPCGDYGKGCAIPPGRYRVVVTRSARFNRDLPLLLDVPGRDGIRMHTGNKPADTDGCIIVGDDQTTLADAWVGRSVVAATKLFPRIAAAIKRNEQVWLTVVEARERTAVAGGENRNTH
jgi:hypothetical protein